MSKLARTTARRDRRIRTGLRLPGNPPVIPAFFDSLESIHQSFSYSHNAAIQANTLLITADRFLSHALSHLLTPGGRHIHVSHTLEELPRLLIRHGIRQLIVDPLSLNLPPLVSLDILRSGARHHPQLQLFVLVSDRLPGLLRFVAASGPFTVVSRHLNTHKMCQCLVTPVPQPSFPPRWRMSPRLWQIIQAMSEGRSLKAISGEQNLPYHRVAYQINRLASCLGVTPRRRFLTLLHYLSLPGDTL
ncbi:hypothetical protein GIX45_19560 [Erwinia sp. CPCC 100877]|nr:hypothetical protein [Erwinia sp. CPCC 100877]